jgi:hypothetical protein
MELKELNSEVIGSGEMKLRGRNLGRIRWFIRHDDSLFLSLSFEDILFSRTGSGGFIPENFNSGRITEYLECFSLWELKEKFLRNNEL